MAAGRAARFVSWLALGLFVAGLGSASRAATQRIPKSTSTEWYFVTEEDGIRVHARDRPGSVLPILRGMGEVQADIFTIASVLSDASRQCEWMTHCMHAERLVRTSDFDQVFYSQASAPWPVSNRDLVFRAVSEYRPKRGEMLTRFATVSHPAQPVRDDFVRMPRLDGFYHFRALGPARTQITLEVDVDPGGMIPDWLIKLVTRTYPLDTLRNLRQQIGRTRGVYDAEVKRLKAAYGDYAVPAPAVPAAKPAPAKQP